LDDDGNANIIAAGQIPLRELRLCLAVRRVSPPLKFMSQGFRQGRAGLPSRYQKTRPDPAKGRKSTKADGADQVSPHHKPWNSMAADSGPAMLGLALRGYGFLRLVDETPWDPLDPVTPVAQSG
jgi:hypothetical protein